MFGVYGCIDSPTVELVDPPDAATSSTPALTDAGSPETPAPAPVPTPTPSVCDARCAAAGGACNGDVCTFVCQGTAACKDDLSCPPGMPCKVSCTGKDACRGVTCRDATSCIIECTSGDPACNGRVTCAGPSCAVTCGVNGCKEDEVRCCADTCTIDGQDARATCR